MTERLGSSPAHLEQKAPQHKKKTNKKTMASMQPPSMQPPSMQPPSSTTKPLTYYEDLRSRTDVSYETRDDSLVIRVDADGESLRLLHLGSFYPLTVPGASGFDSFGRPIRIPFADVFVYWDVGSFVGMVHFNQRDGSVIPDLPERLKDCDLRLTMEIHDTTISPARASRELYPLLFLQNNTLQTPIPGGLIGSILSTVSRPLSVLSGVFGVPQISPGSSTSYFDDQHTNAPYFGRTIPSNRVFAQATLELLDYWNVTHVGLIYTLSDFGLSFLEGVLAGSVEKGIEVTVAAYTSATDEDSVRGALEEVKHLRYIVAVLTGEEPEGILVPALEMGLISDQHVWVMPQLGSIALPTYTVPRSLEGLATALSGAAVVDINFPPNPAFTGALAGLKFNPPMRTFFEESHAEKVFDLYQWDQSIPIITTFAYTGYDAVMAMGIAACEAQQEFFTGPEHYEQIKKTSFDGASGKVLFTPLTGSRRFEGLEFGITNMLIDEEASTNETIRFKSRLSLVLDTTNLTQPVQERVSIIEPFLFHGGGMKAPPSLPPVDMNDNLISDGVHVLGYTLGGLAMAMALGLGTWTFFNRKKKLIRISQPLFLGMMCAGTFLMASSILSLGWQEPWAGLDVACMATPWLLTMGFSTAFSALFTKTWRINMLFQKSANMSRKAIKAKDVLWPFLLITLINVIILSTWTAVAPLKWTRTYMDDSVDIFGRPTQSYGTCKTDRYEIWLILVLFNFGSLVFANYQSYIGRNIPSEFNESFYVALAMASLLECFLIGGPILFLVASIPASDFVVKAVLIAFCCASILVPIYMHKIRNQKSQSKFDARNALSNAWTSTGGNHRSGVSSYNSQVSHFEHSNNHRPQFRGSVAQIRANAARRSVVSSSNHSRSEQQQQEQTKTRSQSFNPQVLLGHGTATQIKNANAALMIQLDKDLLESSRNSLKGSRKAGKAVRSASLPNPPVHTGVEGIDVSQELSERGEP